MSVGFPSKPAPELEYHCNAFSGASDAVHSGQYDVLNARVGRRGLLGTVVVLAVVLWPARAHALPTPDVVVGTVQLLPVLLGAVGAGGAWAARKLWRLLGGHKDARRPLATMAVGFGVAWVVTAVALVSEWSHARMAASSSNLAQALRCDVSFHEHRAKRTRDLKNGALLPRVTVGELAKDLDQRFANDPTYEPILISAVNTRAIYDAGFLGFGPAEHRRYFEYVAPKRVTTYLERIPASERASRDVVIELLSVNENDLDGLVPLLHTFRSVRFVERYRAVRPRAGEPEYGHSGAGNAPTLFVRDEDGTIRPAVFTPPANRDWPLPLASVHYEESHVRFPNMSRLLSADEARDHVYDTPVIVTFGAGYPMDVEVAAEFAFAMFSLRVPAAERALDIRDPSNEARMLAALRKADVYLVDVLDWDEAHVREIADAIGDRAFLTAPVTSLPFLFSLDVPRAIEREARAKHRPFRYLGSTLQMPDAVAAAEIAAKSTSATGALRTRIQGMLAEVIGYIARAVSSTGFALVIFGFGLRAVCLPILVNGRRAKRLQRTIARSKRDYLTRLGAAKRYLRMGTRYELPGALSNLLFLVPFFTNPTARMAGQSFAWIEDLSKPDLLVGVTLGLVFGVVAALMVSPASGRKTIVTFALSAGGLAAAAIVAVPAGIGLYACGGLLVTAVVEVLASRGARAAERRLSLTERDLKPGSVTGECLMLAEAADLEEVGGKASALGKVASASVSTGLFKVPPGVVFRNFAGLPLSDAAAFGTAVCEQMKAKLPGAEAMIFAVRSSAPGEDGANESKAGRYLSILNVPFSGVPEALRKVLDSYGDDAINRNFRVGVLVQSMAPADLAGVMFTRSPSNGGVTHINYTQGLGDRLVSGEVQATELFIARRSGTVRPANGQAKLAERLLLAGMAIEELFGRPQDIEWAYNKSSDTLYILQSRPITAVEYDPAILEEQDKHVQSLDTLTPGDNGTRVQWKRSDVREVVEDPSGLAASIIRETYAREGALTIAGKSLGVHMGEMNVVSLFGQLYEKTGASLVSALRFAFGSWRLKRGIRSAGWPAKLRAECERPVPATALDAEDPRELARQIVIHIRTFIREVYPVAVEATVLAKIAQPKELPKVRTITVEMFEDLGKAAETGDVSRFVERWGTRSESDYDPAAPDFAEDVDALLRYAAGFRGVNLSHEQDAHEQNQPGASVYAELVQLKEITKDRAVRYLRRIRPALLRLASMLEVEPPSIFTLSIESLEGLGNGSRSPQDIAGEVQAGVRRGAAWKTVALGDELSMADLEFLGAFGDAEPTAPSAGAARFVATKRAFSGRVLHLSRLGPNEDPSGAILVTDMLQPSLVRFYGRVAGIISERGAYLSHAAIVGREAGVPILVLPKALSTLPQGTLVTVAEDGAISQAASTSAGFTGVPLTAEQ